MNPPDQEVDQAMDDLLADAGVAARQRIGSQQQHAAYGRLVERITCSGSMGEHEALLKHLEVFEPNAHARQVAETIAASTTSRAARTRRRASASRATGRSSRTIWRNLSRSSETPSSSTGLLSAEFTIC
jgi:hypothetical protein